MIFALSVALASPSWRLAGIYDATAISTLEDSSSSYSYRPRRGMVESCGPAKSPDGMGVFEAEAAGSKLMPVLAIVLTGGDTPLTTENVRVSLGRDKPEILLQPMVVPRQLNINIQAAPGAERIAQLVRTQLETETCMEHKTGRAWTGHDAARVRQAFLLDPPIGVDKSRKYFGGNADPVHALIGPPDACFVSHGPIPPAGAGGKGESSLTLVPTDVWGASLRSCTPLETDGAVHVEGENQLPLRSGDAIKGIIPTPPRWKELSIELRLRDGAGTDEERAIATVRYGDEPITTDTDLFVPTDTVPGMIDLLSMVPYSYPKTGPAEDSGRYQVLLIPNWQLVEALLRLERSAPDTPLRSSPPSVMDGVATVLAQPELLVVQITPESGEAEWPNLAASMRSSLHQPWGYTVGALLGRTPVVLPATAPPTWDQTLRAQRGDMHSTLLGSGLVLFLGLILGIRRWQDLFNPLPEERAHYWPGLHQNNINDNEINTPDQPEESGE